MALSPTSEITVSLTVDQFNALLNLLSTHPFNQVAELIMRIRQQAEAQIQQQAGTQLRGNGEARAIE